MKMISPPPELLAEVARQLLASADELGLAPGAVATTSSAEFGNGFTVPDRLFDHWFLRRGEAAGTAGAPSEPEAFPDTGPPEALVEEVPEVLTADGPEVPEAPAPKRRSRGVAKTEEEV